MLVVSCTPFAGNEDTESRRIENARSCSSIRKLILSLKLWDQPSSATDDEFQQDLLRGHFAKSRVALWMEHNMHARDMEDDRLQEMAWLSLALHTQLLGPKIGS